jgi:hypothetical protein
MQPPSGGVAAACKVLTTMSTSDNMEADIELERTGDPAKLRVFFRGRPAGVIVRDSLGWRLEDGNIGDVRPTPKQAARHLLEVFGYV